jgi:hypothetical protein
MMNIRRAVSRTLRGTALAFAALGCSDKFLQVENPTLIDATTFDPTAHAIVLANSAQQDYQAWYGWHIMYTSWFTGESDVSDTFPTRNEFGYRQVENQNGDLTGSLWGPVSLAAESGKTVLDIALPNPTTNIAYAQAALFRGFAILDMAIDFCQTDLHSGPPLTTTQALDSSIYWFSKAITIGQANGTAPAIAYANAALVGRARAELQEGNNAAAGTDAAAVPPAFVYNLQYVQDLSAANETRLVNRMWQFTLDRGSIDVAAAFRDASDPRLQFLNAAGTSFNPQDVVPGGFYIQQKYPAYAAPIRLASGLEAAYIAAEASGNTATELTLINQQRTANGQGAYAGALDAASVLMELYNQRARDFWLEGRRISDMQRNLAATNYLPVSGTPYIKPGYPIVGTETCWPLPFTETSTNKNFPQSP